MVRVKLGEVVNYGIFSHTLSHNYLNTPTKGCIMHVFDQKTSSLTTNSDVAVLPRRVGVGGEAPGPLASIRVPTAVVVEAAVGVPAENQAQLVQSEKPRLPPQSSKTDGGSVCGSAPAPGTGGRCLLQVFRKASQSPTSPAASRPHRLGGGGGGGGSHYISAASRSGTWFTQTLG